MKLGGMADSARVISYERGVGRLGFVGSTRRARRVLYSGGEDARGAFPIEE